MKLQDCEVLSPKDVKEIQEKLDTIMDIATKLSVLKVEGASTLWGYAYRISWIVSPEQ